MKTKRGKAKKPEVQHNKEETLLDYEVAKINENTQAKSFLKSANKVRGASENAKKLDVPDTPNRSKSENDVRSNSREVLKSEGEGVKSNSDEAPKVESKESVKDTDEVSTSSESLVPETADQKAKKEKIMRLLGLESWEKIFEMERQKEEVYRRSVQEEYREPLKTIIRLKDTNKKKRSRHLKMVIKQQPRRKAEGGENSNFYIHKEVNIILF